MPLVYLHGWEEEITKIEVKVSSYVTFDPMEDNPCYPVTKM